MFKCNINIRSPVYNNCNIFSFFTQGQSNETVLNKYNLETTQIKLAYFNLIQ